MGGGASKSSYPRATYQESPISLPSTQQTDDKNVPSGWVAVERDPAPLPDDAEFVDCLRRLNWRELADLVRRDPDRFADAIVREKVPGREIAALLKPAHIHIELPEVLSNFEAASDDPVIASLRRKVNATENFTQASDLKQLAKDVADLKDALTKYRDRATTTYAQISTMPLVVEAGASTFRDLYAAAASVVAQQARFDEFTTRMASVQQKCNQVR